MNLRYILLFFLITHGLFGKINPGEIVVGGFEQGSGSGSVQEIMLITLAPINAGEQVHVTDGAVSQTSPYHVTIGGNGQVIDQTLSFTVGPNGLPSGTIIIFQNVTSATPSLEPTRSNVTSSDIINISISGPWTLSFGSGGDDLFVYQGTTSVATNFIYAIGAAPSGSQLDPSVPANLTAISNWGLESGRSANYFNFGSSNQKFIGVDPGNINFNGSIDDILSGLGNINNYKTDVNLILNGNNGTTDLTIGTIVPQPTNRYWNGTNWYSDSTFTNLTINPNRTHAPVFTNLNYNTSVQGSLDVGLIVVGNGTDSSSFTLSANDSIQTVYGLVVNEKSAMFVASGSYFNVGDTLEIKSTGSLITEGGSNLIIGGDVNIDGTMTLGADSSGSTDFLLTGGAAQEITGTGTINAQVYVESDGWVYLSAPGSINWSKVTGITKNFVDEGKTRSQANIWSWNPANSGWYPSHSTGNFGDSAYAVYIFTSDLNNTINLEYVADEFDADIVAGQHSYTAKYNVPTGNPINSIGWVGGSLPAANAGWQLVKNPFWSNIAWDVIDDNLPAGVSGAVYIWNSISDSWESWVSGNANLNLSKIPKLSAYYFQVGSAANNTGIVRAKEAIVNSNSRKVFKTTAVHHEVKPQLILNASVGLESKDIYIMFDDNATPSFDLLYDVHQKDNVNGDLYFSNVSADSLSLKTNQVPMPLATDAYFLTFNSGTDGALVTITPVVNYLPAGMAVVLEDLYMKTTTQISNGQSYSFIHKDDAPKQRFKVHFTNINIGLQNLEKEELTVYVDGNGAMVFNENQISEKDHLEVFSMSGQLVISIPHFKGKDINVKHLKPGVYAIQVTQPKSSLRSKILIR